MYVRTTQLEVDTIRISVGEAVEVFEQAVLSGLRDQPGFLGVYVLANDDGRAMLVSFWETAAQAEAEAETGDGTWYSDILAEYVTLFRSPPGRGSYEVRLAVPPVAAGAET